MSANGKWLKIVLPLLIIALGALGMRAMVLSRKAPPKEAREVPGALVEVMETRREAHTATVHGTGTVQPRREVSVTPQVSGRVVEVAPGFVAGGFFRSGELLFAVEEVDYRLAVERAGAALAKAEVELATVESQAGVAREEWQRLNPGEDPNPLVLYEPQLKNARAAVASARAALAQAELDLSRTRVTAPFNCRVRSEQVDTGQYLRAGTGVAALAGTDLAEVIVPLSLEELAWLSVPGPRRAAAGSPARVRFAAGEQAFAWDGHIDRSLGEVDARGRMARVAVTVADPYGLAAPADGRPALEVGMFVDVALEGRTLPAVFALPRKVLRDGDTVWVADGDDRLRIVPVKVLRQERDQVLVEGGLADGERVVLTPLAGAADGMQLRPLPAGGER